MAYVEGTPLAAAVISKDSWMQKFCPAFTRKKLDLALSDLSLLETLNFAATVQETIARSLPQEDISYREIDPESVYALRKFLRQDGWGIIIMRHGQQVLENEPISIKTTEGKLLGMREGHNINDPAEGQSIVEAAAIAVVYAQLARELQIPVHVLTSVNLRASEVAVPTAFLNRFRIKQDPRLNCANYPEDITVDKIDSVLGKDAKGSVYWQKEPVDELFGKGYYTETMMNMPATVKEYSGKGLVVVVTHTPQMNAVDIMCGEKPVRVPELGMRVLASPGNTLSFPNNIFRPAA